jgi:hypothetical protein
MPASLESFDNDGALPSPMDSRLRGNDGGGCGSDTGISANDGAKTLEAELQNAQAWALQILSCSLAVLGQIDLPDASTAPVNVQTLMTLPTLYWVHGLDQAGLLTTLDTVAGLWASGAITTPLPDHGTALQQHWQHRNLRLKSADRQQLLNQVFEPHDFDPAMQRLCQALAALADNAGQHNMAEEVGLQMAAGQVLELCANRLQGALPLAAPELLTQAQTAVKILSQKPLQTAFAVRDLYSLIDIQQRARPGTARQAAQRAQAGAAVLRWLALAGANAPINPQDPALQPVLANAQRWLMP